MFFTIFKLLMGGQGDRDGRLYERGPVGSLYQYTSGAKSRGVDARAYRRCYGEKHQPLAWPQRRYLGDGVPQTATARAE